MGSNLGLVVGSQLGVDILSGPGQVLESNEELSLLANNTRDGPAGLALTSSAAILLCSSIMFLRPPLETTSFSDDVCPDEH